MRSLVGRSIYAPAAIGCWGLRWYLDHVEVSCWVLFACYHVSTPVIRDGDFILVEIYFAARTT